MQGYSVPADMAAWRMSPTYQNAVLREMEGLYGTPNRDSVAVPVPAVCSAVSPSCGRQAAEFHQQNYVTHGWTADHDTIQVAAPVPSQIYVTPIPVQMAEGHPHITTGDNFHSCLATRLCRWTGVDDSNACNAQITCSNVPIHFRNTHGVRKMNESDPISCQWDGCHRRFIRKNFVRHIRERHLDHPRKERRPS
ncbi:hypothetical protein HD554DRAFT_2133395 [Boletus coccyginus]|nr:hypothetical protein HD554DRAFT_2133395 [Boletus coccyginus]